MELSVAQEVALLDPAEQEQILADLDHNVLQYDWNFWGRPGQQTPQPDDWHIWLLSSGRGYGKTAAEVEWSREKVKEHPGCRIALIARTAADVRDTLIQGDSGYLNRLPPSEQPTWEPSKRLLTFPNGATALAFSSEEPSQLRGPQFHYGVCDELAAWRWIADDSGLTAWDNAQIAVRLGENPQIIVGTTPKRLPAIKKLLKDAKDPEKRIVITHGSTRDNLGNLSTTYIRTVYGLFEGTRLARQELEGELLDDVEGALWKQGLLDENRVTMLPQVPLIYVVAVDPSVAEQPTDECGIVVCAATTERDLFKRHMYVVEDASVLGSPSVWANQVVQKAREYGCPIVAEINQGGALIRDALQNIDPNLKVLDVRARYGKQTRAEPIALAYDQHRVHHFGVTSELDDQLTTWVPGETRKSPDRLDALVWGGTALLVKPPQGLWTSPIRAFANAARMRISTPASPVRRARIPNAPIPQRR